MKVPLVPAVPETETGLALVGIDAHNARVGNLAPHEVPLEAPREGETELQSAERQIREHSGTQQKVSR